MIARRIAARSARWACIWAAAAGAATPARADGPSAALGFTSDKVYRGLSQTAGGPAALADLSWRADAGWSAGVGLAHLARKDGADGTELTLHAGRDWQLDDAWTLQATAVRYIYPFGGRGLAYPYTELAASVGWRGRVYGSVALSPNSTGYQPGVGLRSGRTMAWELSAQQPLAGGVSLDAGLGWYDLRRVAGASYPYGSVGLDWQAGRWQLYLSYITSRAAQRGVAEPSIAGDRWVGTVLWGF